MTKSLSRAVTRQTDRQTDRQTEVAVWNIEPTSSSQNPNSLNRDLPKSFCCQTAEGMHFLSHSKFLMLFLLDFVSSLESKPSSYCTEPIISEAIILHLSYQFQGYVELVNHFQSNFMQFLKAIPSWCCFAKVILFNCKFFQRHLIIIVTSFEWGVKVLLLCTVGERTQLYLSLKDRFAMVFLPCCTNDVVYMGRVFQQLGINCLKHYGSQ